MASSCVLVVVAGPPSMGLASVLQQQLSSVDEYEQVYAQQLFIDNPGFGVRDVVNKVVTILRQKRKVVVMDTCSSRAVRDSLLKVIPKKVASCSMRCIQLLPKHAHLQAMWERQFFLAADCPAHFILSDDALRCWFEERGSSVVGNSEPGVNSSETVKVQLTVASQYKLEVAGLLLQWECLLDTGGYLEEKVKDICRCWLDANQCGRVIVLCDGGSVSRGTMSAAEEGKQIELCVRAFALELNIPVYVLRLRSTLEAGEFSLPPSPGLLAFLQRRHNLDLHHRHTLYVYSDAKHMKMAERAGVRHIKIRQVLQNPQVMSTCHSATLSPISDMLRDIQVVCDTSSTTNMSMIIPLADHLDRFAEHHIHQDLPRGYREYVFANDVQTIERYQALYAANATPVGQPGSKMTTKQRLPSSTALSHNDTTIHRTTEVTQLRQIPSWMLSKQNSTGEFTAQGTLQKSDSSSSAGGRGSLRSRNMVYIMTEKELVEVAQEILKETKQTSVGITCESNNPATDPVSRKRTATPVLQDKDTTSKAIKTTVTTDRHSTTVVKKQSARKQQDGTCSDKLPEFSGLDVNCSTLDTDDSSTGTKVAADTSKRSTTSDTQMQNKELKGAKSTKNSASTRTSAKKHELDFSVLDEIFF